MGSRKKKTVTQTQKQQFIAWYKLLTPNDRIAFKWFAFADGRRRWTLQHLLKPNTYWGRTLPYSGGGIFLKDAIENGYTIRWQ
jgi:hypothetical protein